MQRRFIVLIYFFIVSLTFSQSASDFGISFSGFVKTDVMLDNRQNITARAGHFLLYPQNEVLDANGKDINASGSFNILAIQTRLKGSISAPDFLGAKTSGVIEGAFFGNINTDINGFRLRHAFVKMAWTNTTLLIGQYWNPMFITSVFPGTVSFNTGVPFQPFARNPQIRLVQSFGSSSVTIAASSERDFTSTGPIGTTCEYMRNSSLPMLDFHFQHSFEALFLGAGVNYKALKPRLSTANNYKEESTVNSYAVMVYAKYFSDNFNIKAEGTYGQNLYNQLMIGGYAVSSVDPVTDEWDYTPYKTISTWIDTEYGKSLKLGLFAGYTANLGTDENIAGNTYARGADIEYIYRVSPRAIYQYGKVRFAAELEYTVAAYGTVDYSDKGAVRNAKEIGNFRILLGSYLFF